ncbi:sulfotransferase domain-containing protein [Pseudenhygromyxa sp. WMMC2535]|uniref:sulfotransferase domain-containing protein n=1 Tax=Pseudenhygromyxa sp. WMMC2535 TaxID=2712867 RepID=UPI0015572F2A|nr:sulfotransferase domain-containing protein [Pseudenhygromyxa sp. WMMC2535]NVB40629.1 sulfotransferase domain-containing protein [Pseudenhygromyxa sp. WMMC2535]
MHETAPLLSPLLPMQLFIRAGRRLGHGVPVLMAMLQRMASKDRKPAVFAGYEPQAHDVFVTCFSKSGTNWAMQLVTQIANRGAAEFRHIHHLVPWPDGRMPGVVGLEDPGPWTSAPAKMRAIKTALEADYVPWSAKARYLCVVRDPKEILVSAYYFLTGVFGLREHVSPQEWIEHMLRPGSFITDWPAHADGYWRWRERPNTRLLFYADLGADLGASVDAIAALMDVKLTAEERAEVVRRGGFAYMKAHESCFAPPRMPLLTGSRRGQMVRAGRAGDSGEFLSPAHAEALDAQMLAGLDALGSDFPYAERFMRA